jgi:hypothetical protein
MDKLKEQLLKTTEAMNELQVGDGALQISTLYYFVFHRMITSVTTNGYKNHMEKTKFFVIKINR